MSSAETKAHQGEDAVTRAANAIRDAILGGEFLPGEQLRVHVVSEQLGFSRTTVSQALSRVASEGFAKAVPRVGVFVRRMTLNEQRQVFEYRIGLETAACVLACRNASDEELEALEELGAQVDGSYGAWREERRWNRSTLFEHEVTFHGRLFDISHNEEFRNTVSRSKVMFWIYHLYKVNRAEFLPVLQEGRKLVILHVDIARAIRSREPAKAAAAIHDHLAHTLESFDALIEREENSKHSQT